MAISQRSQGLMRYIAEATYGTTPASGNWSTLRMNTETLSAQIARSRSDELLSHRQATDAILDNVEVGGDINFELSYGTFDAFFESVFNNAWSTNVLKIGNTRKSFSFEREFTDFASGNEFQQYRGVIVPSMTLTVPGGTAKRITGTFNLMGKEAVAPATATLVVTGTTAATTTAVMTGGSNLTLNEIDSGAPPAGICLNSLEITIDNSAQGVYCLGADSPSEHIVGRCEVMLKINSFVDPNTIEWVTAALNGTAKQILFTMSDGTSSYAWEFSNMKFSTDSPSLQDDGPIEINVEATALYDVTDASAVVLTRTP